MKTIYKYRLGKTDCNAFPMPPGAKFIRVELQDDKWKAWAIIDNDATERVIRKIWIVSTGNPMPDAHVEYLNTFFDGPFVWHVFVEPEGSAK